MRQFNGNPSDEQVNAANIVLNRFFIRENNAAGEVKTFESGRLDGTVEVLKALGFEVQLGATDGRPFVVSRASITDGLKGKAVKTAVKAIREQHPDAVIEFAEARWGEEQYTASCEGKENNRVRYIDEHPAETGATLFCIHC